MKTFIRWPGNKSKHVNKILPFIPNTFNTYIEPFVGSGALFLKLEPKTWISIIVISYNASKNHIRKCLESVRCQYGRHIGIEIVWVDDHSDQIYNSILESEFKRFLKLSRFCKLSYYKMNNHVGTEECLRKSASWCKFKLLFHICCTETIVPYRVLELCN